MVGELAKTKIEDAENNNGLISSDPFLSRMEIIDSRSKTYQGPLDGNMCLGTKSLKLTEYIADMQNKKVRHEFILAYNHAIWYADRKVIESCDKFLEAWSIGADIDQVNAAINEIFRNYTRI